MTTTQPAPIDYSKHPARIDPSSAGYAQFPPVAQLPKGARDAIEPFLALRRRRADVAAVLAENSAGLTAAKLADANRLREHVREGGSAATFKADAEDAAVKAVKAAQADLGILDSLLSEQYVKTCRALQGMADEGAKTAATAAEKAAARYTAAITELEQARQDYLAGCAVVLFWRFLTVKGSAIVAGGDAIHLKRGPVTKVDQTTLHLLRQDATTHQRCADAEL